MITSQVFVAGVLGLGAPELVVILIIMLVLFGGTKLPSLARGLGESIKEFKKASRDEPAPPPATLVSPSGTPPAQTGEARSVPQTSENPR